MTAFEELGVLPELGQAVDEMGWTLPSDIQAEGIPAILGGGDVLMAAETGSGKTGAFCLPVLQIVWETLRDQMTGKNSGKKHSSAWVLNPYDRDDSLAIDPDGLLCQSREPQKWQGARCNHGVFGKGKYYYEGTVTDDGLCRLGWSTEGASLDLGTDKYGFGYGGTGKKSNCKKFDNYGTSFTLGDTIGCMLDLDSGHIGFSKNGQNLGKAFDIPAQLKNSAFYPAILNEFRNFLIQKSIFQGYVGVSSADEGNVVKPEPNAPACIIIEPTKELAEQTNQQIEIFKKNLKNPAVSIPVSEQIRNISAGVDIITCTPGRLLDFVQTEKILVSNCRFFILDEADSLVSAKNHLSTIERLYSLLPKITPDGTRLQMIVCSATLHNFDVKKLAVYDALSAMGLSSRHSAPCDVDKVKAAEEGSSECRTSDIECCRHFFKTDGIHFNDDIRPGSETPETLSEGTKILKAEYLLKAIRQHNMDQGIIFCRTKLDCDNIERFLNSYASGKAKFLICTDVAARGIDVRGVPFVINVTLPDEKANYLHRIGRVGRAERMGLAISLVSAHPEKVWYHTCPSRGLRCNNTNLTSQRGCAIWYDEMKLLEDIEEHLGVTIAQIDNDMIVPVDEFDGKVVYGAKSGYAGHAVQLSGAVALLADLERSLQLSYLRMFNDPKTENVK
ncbi:unnamed protein product [Enterobius vermicularis]|uniref:ATP-dependent RNA helicase n=1 Tax=Enterobius vermicularis TaxID=51028 RepID=A0A0N4V4Q3_ENTVE|nr:unnamed protein product [Enterobius vermicularis]